MSRLTLSPILLALVVTACADQVADEALAPLLDGLGDQIAIIVSVEGIKQ